MSDHSIVYDLLSPAVGTWECRAPKTAVCHAIWDCECENITDYTVMGGKPYHRNAADPQMFHTGRFDPSTCTLRDWYENQDECVEGLVRVDVDPVNEWDYVIFTATRATLVTEKED